jgi:hypothetical protein
MRTSGQRYRRTLEHYPIFRAYREIRANEPETHPTDAVTTALREVKSMPCDVEIVEALYKLFAGLESSLSEEKPLTDEQIGYTGMTLPNGDREWRDPDYERPSLVHVQVGHNTEGWGTVMQYASEPGGSVRVIVWDEPTVWFDAQLLPGEYVLPEDCVQLPAQYDRESWTDEGYDNVRLAHAERLWNGFKPTEDKKVTVL